MPKSKEIQLASRPQGTPQGDNFKLAEVDVAAPAANQVLVRNLWMSVDPYMRGRMNDTASYVPPFQIDQPLQGGAIGEVVESQHPDYQPGDRVLSMLGWREQFVSDPEQAGMQKLPADDHVPLQSYLGSLGMPGMTAYAGLLRIGQPKGGETVFVSAASGAVGAIVCQIARIKGCRVVGSAGSDAKCSWLKDKLGVDEVINYKTCGSLQDALAAACPKGIDVYFENVGGEHLQSAINLMNPFGRIVACGMIGQYNVAEPTPGPNNLIQIVGKSLLVQGFIVSNHMDLYPEFLKDMGEWATAGKMHWEETIHEGIAKSPEAFIGLFSGDNFGKMLVKLA